MIPYLVDSFMVVRVQANIGDNVGTMQKMQQICYHLIDAVESCVPPLKSNFEKQNLAHASTAYSNHPKKPLRLKFPYTSPCASDSVG